MADLTHTGGDMRSNKLRIGIAMLGLALVVWLISWACGAEWHGWDTVAAYLVGALVGAGNRLVNESRGA